ncbi:hypothetical protein PMAYCL1PPCAC_33202, partial [Pristionchus mayeri]
LFLIPLFFSSIHAACLNVTANIRCGGQPFTGQMVVTIWDANHEYFGGDEKIMTAHYNVVNGGPVKIEDT